MTAGFAHFRGLRVAQSRAVSEGQWAEAAPQGAAETRRSRGAEVTSLVSQMESGWLPTNSHVSISSFWN